MDIGVIVEISGIIIYMYCFLFFFVIRRSKKEVTELLNKVSKVNNKKERISWKMSELNSLEADLRRYKFLIINNIVTFAFALAYISIFIMFFLWVVNSNFADIPYSTIELFIIQVPLQTIAAYYILKFVRSLINLWSIMRVETNSDKYMEMDILTVIRLLYKDLPTKPRQIFFGR